MNLYGLSQTGSLRSAQLIIWKWGKTLRLVTQIYFMCSPPILPHHQLICCRVRISISFNSLLSTFPAPKFSIQHVHSILNVWIIFLPTFSIWMQNFSRQSSLALRDSTAINNRDALFRYAKAFLRFYLSFVSLSDDNLLMSSNKDVRAWKVAFAVFIEFWFGWLLGEE